MFYVWNFPLFGASVFQLFVHKVSFIWYGIIIGLANKKTVTIQPAGKDQSVLLATTKTKKQNKPAALLHKSVMKKEFRRMAKAVQNQVIWQRSMFCRETFLLHVTGASSRKLILSLFDNIFFLFAANHIG